MSTTARTAAVKTSAGWKVFGISFAFVAALMTLWSFASPLTSVPDEPSHMVRAAAVVRGELVGKPLAVEPWLMQVEVPQYIARVSERTCFVSTSDPWITPDCYKTTVDSPDKIVPAGTSAGPNNPVYYAAVGWPTLFLSGDVALYAMRIVNALLCAALFGFMFMALSRLPRSRWATLAGITAITPMVLFLGGAVNPNGFEVAAAAALFSTLITTLRLPSPGGLLWQRGAIIVFSALLLVTARSVAFLWLALILAGAFALADRAVLAGLGKRVATWVTLGLSAVACVIGLVWLAVPLHLAAGDPYPGTGLSFRIGFETILTQTFDFAQAWIGVFGWIQIPAPTETMAIWIAAMACLILPALALTRGRFRILAILWTAAVVFLPPILQGAVVTQLGYIWQGRYNLAVVACLLIAVGMALDDRFSRPLSADAARLVQWGLWLLAFGQLIAFLWPLKHFTVADRTWLEMIVSPSWSPPGSALLLGLLFAAVLAAAVLLLRRSLIGERTATSLAAASAR